VAEAFALAERLARRLGDAIAARARAVAAEALEGGAGQLDLCVFDREGRLVGHSPSLPRKRR